MRLFALLLVLAPFTAKAGSKVIAAYAFGNQIYGSQLVILDDGRVLPKERTCCPPTYKDGLEQKLSTRELAVLKSLIEQAASGEVGETACRGAMGEIYGKASVFTASGEEVLLRADSLLPDGRCATLMNDAPAVEKIEAILFRFVKTKPQN